MPDWFLQCPRCSWRGEIVAAIDPCPRCRADGIAMAPEVTRTGPATTPRDLLFPVDQAVTLGEGDTPLVALRNSPGVFLKDERANPTGSFKDRMASAAVSWALSHGYDTVALASTGNAALSVAAYAASAGLRCVVLAKEGGVVPGVLEPLRAMNAELHLTNTYAARWDALAHGVHHQQWFPVSNYQSPPVSSHPVGVRAYRSIAYEIVEQLGRTAPEQVVIPVSRGDALAALWAGFQEMHTLGWIERLPRMLAVVRLPSLRDALLGGLEQPQTTPADGPVEAVSISDPLATAMAVRAVRESRGDVLVVDDDQLRTARAQAYSRGWPLELSSAAVLAGIGMTDEAGTTVGLVTAAGSR
ncbi:pyridoxal-phosphate dependent enzyme [Kineosporia sp. NBRC 101731]|uniref:pyridoxal-phosphate dependent enzyme n=1 Tax=Kineosporia sp. NBRC 101731 TaxID=3032199 RepID=UPI0024A50A41|nr:pyridoxal-phosphate dependent enzyme [Kineosporia sp. NBRC 101731]GLY29151.1 threonine synthase [Kineosporia sp. NBRC 101731]